MTTMHGSTPPVEGARAARPSLRRYLATSDRPLPALVRRLHRKSRYLSLPAPRLIVRPILRIFLALRTIYYFGKRVFICEPLFKAYCKQYGKNLRTGTFIHWVEGKGDIIIGDNVEIDGKCAFTFAARFVDTPTLVIGDNTGIGHGSSFVVGRRIVVGRNCIISGAAVILGSNGHPSAFDARQARQPPPADEVRDVIIGDDVWIGRQCMIFPGVRIGQGSVIAAGSVVRTHVPPFAVVAGNPAKVMFRLKPPGTTPSAPAAVAPAAQDNIPLDAFRMTQITGAQVLVRALKEQGVARLFSLPGVGILPVYEACLREQVEVVAGRHEAAIVQTAEGWARVAGEPAVALLAEGPGHANAVAGIATAHAECSPLLALSAAAESGHRGKGVFQELPQVEMCAPITKSSTLLTDPRCIRQSVADSMLAARTGVPGPVHLSLAADMLQTTVEEAAISPPLERPRADAGAPAPELVERAVELLAGAERPLVIAGSLAFWSRAGDALRGLVETARLPLFTVERARGLVPDDHPFCFGEGYSGVNPAARLFHHADVVLLLGENFDCRFAFGKCFGKAKLIHVHPETAELGKHCDIELGMACDVRAAMEHLLRSAQSRPWPEKAPWLKVLRETVQEHAAHVNKAAASTESPLHPARIAREVERLLDPSAILVFDGGDFPSWARYCLRALRPGGWQISTLFGQIGTGLPYAIGAKLAAPGSRVVLLTGDGALGFSIIEFETAVRHRIPVVVVVGNDAAWGIERYYQTALYGPQRLTGTALGDVRWDQMALAMGGCGEYVETAEQLRPALERALASHGPACVNVMIRPVPSPLAQSYARMLRRRVAQDKA